MAYNRNANANAKKEALKDYIEVNERLLKFRADYPEGCIIPEIVKWEDGVIVMKATVYLTREDMANGTPVAVGHAYEVEGSSYINKTSALENCETSAVGRALAILGYEIKRSVASREEVENAKRQQEAIQLREAKQKQEGAITPDQIGEIKTRWLKLGYSGNALNMQLQKMFGCRLEQLTQPEAKQFIGKLDDLENTAEGAKKNENQAG
jgi:hypothetical protein